MKTTPTHQPRLNQSIHLLLLALLPLALLPTSCANRQLVGVHNVYRAEFKQQLESGRAPTPADLTFPKTVAAIQTFREKHPDRDDALKHITVLEAMVHLQSGKFGLATDAAVRADEMPGSLATHNQELLRDALFLKALRLEPGLIEAFEMIHGNAPKEEDRLKKCGDGLAALAREHHGINGDDGAIYIAAAAADCYLHAAKAATLLAVGDKRAQLIREAELEYGTAAMEALAPHLTEREINADQVELKRLAATSPRYRYVRFHHIAKTMRDRHESDP